MAAKSVRIDFHTSGATAPVLSLEPRWWDKEALRRDPRFVESNETGSYFDWDADLSLAEFRELHERFRPLANQGVFEYSGWQARIGPELEQIDAAVAGDLGPIRHVHVAVFEWESGC